MNNKIRKYLVAVARTFDCLLLALGCYCCCLWATSPIHGQWRAIFALFGSMVLGPGTIIMAIISHERWEEATAPVKVSWMMAARIWPDPQPPMSSAF